MTNPYIQNFISAKQQGYTAPAVQPVAMQKNQAQKAQEGMQNQSSLRPNTPAGYIVKENLIQSAGSSITGLGKTGVYFVNAMNGKGTDYTVGRINDGARFVGSLGIAAALASAANSPKAKVMEFVGFATWFTAMSLWPKMLGTTIKATKGVDINQEYVDSYGRRKRFFEDAQYITWDLYKDKDLHKMGDKLGVPRNIENRKDAIKEKAKQVATQGNTLMMLTAGFATPIGTALICNALENPVSKAIEFTKVWKAEQQLKKLETVEVMTGAEKGLAELNDIIGPGETVKLNPDQVGQLKKFYSRLSGHVEFGIERELADHLNPVVELNEKAKAGFRNAFNLSDDFVRGLATNNDGEFAEHVYNGIKEVLGEVVDPKSTILDDVILKEKDIQSSAVGYVSSKIREKGLRGTFRRDLLSSEISKNIGKVAEENKVVSLPRTLLEGLYKAGHEFNARTNVIHSYAGATIANVADSQTANNWATAPREILEALGMDKKTRSLIANDPIKAADYLQTHLETLAKDQHKLDKAVEKISKVVENIVKRESKAARKLNLSWERVKQANLMQLAGCDGVNFKDPKTKPLRKDVIKTWVEIFQSGRTKQNAIECKKEMERIAEVRSKELSQKYGKKIEFKYFDFASEIIHTVDLEKTKVQNKLMNTKSSFYRPLLVLDKIKDPKVPKEIIKELISGMGIDFWSNKGEHRGIRNAEGFIDFVKKAFDPITNILNKGKEELKLGDKISKFYEEIKAPLIHIDGSNRRFYDEKSIKKIASEFLTKNSYDDIVTKNPSDWAERVGKNLNSFIRDAAQEQGIKKTWLGKVLFVAAPVVAVSLLAISQFGKKNKFNPDIYEVKK